MLIELDPVDRITADAVGQPGSRAFYLQGRKGDQVVTLLVEKQQVQLLAASVVEILARVGKETGQGPPEEAMDLEEPVIPEWRAGRLSIGYLEDRDLLMLEVEELLPEQEEQGESGDEEQAGGLEALGPELRIVEESEEQEPDEPENEPDLSDRGGKEELSQGLPERLTGVPTEGDPSRVRFWATREQMLSLARHGAVVCSAGRPRCQLCGNPIDPEGHRCPALNGHKELNQG